MRSQVGLKGWWEYLSVRPRLKEDWVPRKRGGAGGWSGYFRIPERDADFRRSASSPAWKEAVRVRGKTGQATSTREIPLLRPWAGFRAEKHLKLCRLTLR